MILLGVTGAAVFWLLRREEALEPWPETERHRQVRGAVLHHVTREVVEEVLRIEEQEKRVAETVWAKEMQAQECGRTIEKLWDEINQATNKLEVLARFGVKEVRLGKWDLVEELPHGIRVWSASGAGETLTGEEWNAWVEGKMREGWVLEQVEFRQNRFEGTTNEPSRSVFYFAANLLNAARNERASIEGDLEVEWGAKDAEGMWRVKKVDASRLVIKTRKGEPVFRMVMDAEVAPFVFRMSMGAEVVPLGQLRLVDPLIVYDLDGDGASEIILAAANRVYSPQRHRGHGEEKEQGLESLEHRTKSSAGASPYPEGRSTEVGTNKNIGASRPASPYPAWEFAVRELCKFPEEYIKTAVVADFDGDGAADFLCAQWDSLFLFKGATNGVFETKPRNVWKAEQALQLPMVMTCGDVDRDGDLDLFIGQYKDPYEGGMTPRPFYDANDGFPAFLLVNDGRGGFSDGTVAAGLAKNRNRRTFSASFVDLDRDEDLDLMVVSDFAGIDFYANDGKGRFAEVTSEWVREPKERVGFGMAHSLADFNNDGLLDVLMIGMTSPTMDRLNEMGLMRTTNAVDRAMEVAMTYGNRLLFGKREGGFEQRPVSDSIARAGWAWGCANLDFDNDGWVDVYIANGFQSRATVRDSEGDYWLHDRFLESELGAQATDLYFKSSGARSRGSERSFGGNERNRLFWNRGGTNFVEVGYLLGVSIGADSRNVVADDLDGDGRAEIVMMTSEVWPKARQTLKVFRNELETGRSDFRSGSKVAVHAKEIGKVQSREIGGRKEVKVYVTGGGFRTQGPPKIRSQEGGTGRNHE